MAKAKYTYNEKRKEWSTLVYDGTLTPSGEKHRVRVTSKKSSADLERKVNEIKAKLASEDVILSTITFGEYAQTWLSLYKTNKELNTLKMYKTIVNNYFYMIDDMRLTDIRHSNFQQIINMNSEHPRTCQKIKLTFKQIIKSAVRDHYLPHSAIDDITSDISMPKYLKPQKRALTELEKQSLKAANLSDMKRAFVTILYYCGIRKGEALALTVDDFDFIKNTVSISKTIIHDNNTPILKPYPKSDNGIRVIPLPDDAQVILKDYVSNCNGYLFKGKDKEMMTDTAYKRMWQSIITELNKAAGYDPKKKNDKPIQGLTAHVFRHNYCTMLCYQIPTISTKKIAQLLGDTEKMVLDVYSHILDENEDVSGAINSAF